MSIQFDTTIVFHTTFLDWLSTATISTKAYLSTFVDANRRILWGITFDPFDIKQVANVPPKNNEDYSYLGIYLRRKALVLPAAAQTVRARYRYWLLTDSYEEIHYGCCDTHDFACNDQGCGNSSDFPKRSMVMERLRSTSSQRLFVRFTILYESEEQYLYDSLADDFRLLQDNEQTADVVLHLIGDDRIYVHKSILAARSPYFNAMFLKSGFRESTEEIVKITNATSAIFRAISTYCYSGIIEFHKFEDHEVCEILFAADFYQCKCAFSMTEEELISRVSLSNVIEILMTTKQCASATRVQTACKKLIVQKQTPVTFESVDALPVEVLQCFLSS